ncbi:CzcA family heavy metal efflux pump [Roseimicrobium gellanilyticum]|uniref:CzcA family heavy metal efflux pump n=1 Tax=Roseimicrobium gellanilyticum TaxID=748857 RepID=A0A366HL16_9BACT|nr:efflux RND transporter permease subunit [Roseimicrobium gellanilyticum]RBP42453.1 CzcA family heavy metal efflux pump [Roseimicrobium gellanilyticum]
MLNKLIRFSLHHRPLVLMASVLLMVFGYQTLTKLPVEVLPDMTKPTVTLLTECPGLAPEEVEMLVTQPLESAIQGVASLDRVRSNSDVGLSLVFAEFAWGTDIYRARQLVQERVQAVLGNLPKDVTPGMTPVSSLMGEILLVGVKSNKKPGEKGYMEPRDLRTLADWTLRRRLQSINGVADVLNIGGGVKQVQVQPDPNRMLAYDVSLEEINIATAKAAGNATSGYLQAGPKEIMVRNLGMSTSLEELGKTVVKMVKDRPILLQDVAKLDYGVQIMRGDASVNGQMGVILSIDKAPGFDTLRLTEQIEKALEGLKPTLPEGVELELLFRQGDFITHAIDNLKEAIRDGAIMVTVVLFLFLLSIRTTFITVMAMPLSFAITLLVFRLFEVSVNSMTLGGLAVAIGMVVDDAIVDVENVFRRLRENASLANPKPRMEVIATASGEVRNSILYATVLIILVFLPLLGLEGLEGRLFTPIAIATMVSMAGSFVVSLTVIPVMCSLLLKPKEGKDHGDGFVVRAMKNLVRHTFLRAALGAPLVVIAIVGALMVAALLLYPVMGKEFLPAFNEGSATISLANAPGTSLAQTNEVGELGVKILMDIKGVKSVGRRAGRAERDDHVVPVSVNEFDVEFDEGGRPREEVFKEIREKLAAIPGTAVNVGQPIGHRLSHMLSGVSAKIAIKVFGPNIDVLREKGAQIRDIGQKIPGLTDVYLEAQVPIPQLKIEVNRERAMAYGIQPGALNEQMSALIGGTALTELREGERSVDLVLRLPPEWRDSPEKLGDVLVEAAGGRRVPLRLVADIRESKGPNVINRENTQRRIVISANTSERDLQSIVQRWEKEVKEKVDFPEGYYPSFEGEFRAQQEAARTIAFYFVLVLFAIVILLYGYFRSLSLALQVMLNIPLALIGGLALTWFLINNISIATIVGFIAVGGVAARNGIMMISHYLHLMKHEGESFGPQMIIRGTLERLVPVVMTALSAGIALIPLLLSAHEPGKEILHPVAVVIVGGLVSSTLLDLVVTPAVFYLFGRSAAESAVRNEAPAAH